MIYTSYSFSISISIFSLANREKSSLFDAKEKQKERTKEREGVIEEMKP